MRLKVEQVSGHFGLAEREVVEHPPAVTVLPFESPDAIYLIKQYRKAIDDFLIEAPAGCMELNEDPEKAAIRELKEETGFTAGELINVGEMFMAPGFCNEFMTIFLATELTSGTTRFDEDECMELQKYSFKEIKSMIHRSEIKDAKTIVAVQYLADFFKNEF